MLAAQRLKERLQQSGKLMQAAPLQQQQLAHVVGHDVAWQLLAMLMSSL